MVTVITAITALTVVLHGSPYGDFNDGFAQQKLLHYLISVCLCVFLRELSREEICILHGNGENGNGAYSGQRFV